LFVASLGLFRRNGETMFRGIWKSRWDIGEQSGARSCGVSIGQTGMLGLARGFSNAALASAAITMAIFLEFATFGHGAPCKAQAVLTHDEQLLTHMRTITETAVADGSLFVAQRCVL
jgi:hypothetical protein